MEKVPVTIDNGSQQLVTGEAAEAARRQLAAESEAMRKKIGSGGSDKIRLTKKKTFKLPDGQESAEPLRVCVLDFVAYKAFYDRDFSEKNKVPPACFALAPVKLIELVPSANSPDKQSTQCGISGKSGCCPLNEFGSKGNGKACGDHYLLAVVGMDKPDSEMYTIQLPPKSVKYWEAYVQQTLREKPGLVAVSTEIWFDPDSEHQLLRFGRALDNPFIVEHMARRKSATARLLTEPDVSAYEPPPAKPGRR